MTKHTIRIATNDARLVLTQIVGPADVVEGWVGGPDQDPRTSTYGTNSSEEFARWCSILDANGQKYTIL